MLASLTNELVFSYFLVFCRLGAAIMLLPGLSEAYISARARLIVSLILSLIVTPVVSSSLPPPPDTITALALAIAKEIVIGLFLGVIAKIILGAMHVAGTIISYQSGLAAGAMFDPSQGEQGAIVGTFLTFMAILLIFATNLHHLFLQGLVQSYHLFSTNTPPPLHDYAKAVAQTVSTMFLIGLKMAIPHVVVGLIVFLGAGVMGRLMPQMQVFFVIIPLQILMSFFILMITLSGTFIWFMNYYRDVWHNIFS